MKRLYHYVVGEPKEKTNSVVLNVNLAQKRNTISWNNDCKEKQELSCLLKQRLLLRRNSMKVDKPTHKKEVVDFAKNEHDFVLIRNEEIPSSTDAIPEKKIDLESFQHELKQKYIEIQNKKQTKVMEDPKHTKKEKNVILHVIETKMNEVNPLSECDVGEQENSLFE